jgi:transposase
MAREELEALTQAELIELILTQAEQQAQLQAAFEQLQADYEALKLKFEKNRKPPTSSQNSSQPPSKDQKGSLPKDRRKRRHGPPVGHKKHERKFVAQADQVIDVRAQDCSNCQADLRPAPGRLVKVNQITELPAARAQVIEVRQFEVICPHCRAAQVAAPPAGLEMRRAFGARLEATVVYYRQAQHMSYERTQKALCDLNGVTISQGGIDEIMKRAGQQAIARLASLEAAVRQSAVIYSDETSCRVEGANWWEWVFCTANTILHVIRFNRSVDVIQSVMAHHQAEVWVSDCLLAQLNAPARQRQICLAHQLRNLQAVVDAEPHLWWAQAMQALFRAAIHLHHQRQHLSPEPFGRQVARLERLCNWLLLRSLSPPAAQRLQRRYQKYRAHLFVFLYRTDVEPTNNVSERALRPSVIHRKVTGGFRSEWGAKAYAALASVIETAELSGIRAFAALQSLFAPPALPIPVRGE